MTPVVARTEVDRSAAEVFAYATDPSRFAEWQTGVVADFTSHGIGRLPVPLVVRRQARAEMPANLATLKQRLETRPTGAATPE